MREKIKNVVFSSLIRNPNNLNFLTFTALVVITQNKSFRTGALIASFNVSAAVFALTI